MAVTDPRSRNEEILRATIDGTEYVAPPQSRIEDLLIQLKEAIEQGGGGGGGDVTGVKGSAESTYRKGNVNLTAENIGVEAGAEVNTIESVTLNGDTVTPDANKNVALVVITNTVNNLVNYYLKTETYSKSEVDAIAALLKNGHFIYVNELPTTDIDQTAIYLVPKSSAQTNNVKDEYINLDGTSAGWEKIGDTQIDLSDYVTTTQLTTALADYTTTTALTALLADKVDKVSGKGLSTNDYTSADKAKLESLTRVQYDVMPTASGARVGMVVQYIGATNANYTHNYVYECVDNGGSYAWVQTDVQPNEGGGHTIENASGTALTQRDTLQFKGGLSVSDDSTNQKTVVSDIYPEIEYSVWDAMTPQEQEAIPNAIILNAPDSGGGDGVSKSDVVELQLEGTTNTSGGTITAGTWFYLNDKLVKAKVDIASNATFTKDTNYEEKTIGEELSELNSKIIVVDTQHVQDNVVPGRDKIPVSVNIPSGYSIVSIMVIGVSGGGYAQGTYAYNPSDSFIYGAWCANGTSVEYYYRVLCKRN